jgi:hypothetical protein
MEAESQYNVVSGEVWRVLLPTDWSQQQSSHKAQVYFEASNGATREEWTTPILGRPFAGRDLPCIIIEPMNSEAARLVLLFGPALRAFGADSPRARQLPSGRRQDQMP